MYDGENIIHRAVTGKNEREMDVAGGEAGGFFEDLVCPYSSCFESFGSLREVCRS